MNGCDLTTCAYMLIGDYVANHNQQYDAMNKYLYDGLWQTFPDINMIAAVFLPHLHTYTHTEYTYLKVLLCTLICMYIHVHVFVIRCAFFHFFIA